MASPRAIATEVAAKSLDLIYSMASAAVQEEAPKLPEAAPEPKACAPCLEATISGEQLGHLLASQAFQKFSGKDLTISIDEVVAQTLYNVATRMTPRYASEPMQCQIYWPNNWQGWQSNERAAPKAARSRNKEAQTQGYNRQPQAYHSWPQNSQQYPTAPSERRKAPTAPQREPSLPQSEPQDGDSEAPSKKVRKPKLRQLSDLIVVSTRPGQPGDKAILECTPPEEELPVAEDRRKTLVTSMNLTSLALQALDDPFEEEEEEEKESDELVEVLKPSISHKQAFSVKLLDSLERIERRHLSTAPAPHLALPASGQRPRTTPCKPPGKGKTLPAHRYYSVARPTTVGSRPQTVESSASSKGSGSKPEWDTSFYTVHQRRIPTYDALIDETCPVLSSPERLRHIMETRELPDAYLHIVRSRFEQHRRFFDKEGRLGRRAPPEQFVMPEPEAYPDRLLERLVSGFEGENVETKVEPVAFSLEALGREASKTRQGPRGGEMLCPEWLHSTLHEEVLEAVETVVDISVEPTEQGTLAPRWKKLEGEIKLHWHRLQIPLDLRTAMDDGPLTQVTPETLYQLQEHLQHMRSYEAATKKLIKKWLKRESLLESVCASHALGVNDQRLVKLKADVQRLDKLSCSLVKDIGSWCGRFRELIVDPSKATAVASKPRAIFVWAGRDAVERIQQDAARLLRGDLSVPLSESKMQGSEAENSVSQRFKDWGFASQKSKGALPPCALASATVAAQNFKVTEVLFEGPAPSWYRPAVARAGIKALKRGIPCGGGDKRL